MLSDAQWELIAPMLPTRTGRPGRPFSDARMMLEAIIYRYRCFDRLARSARGLRAVAEKCGPGIDTWPKKAPGIGCFRC